MKKIIIMVCIFAFLLLCFIGCNKTSNINKTTDSEIPIKDEEISSLLAGNDISNVEKTKIVHELTLKELDRAERYKTLLKSSYIEEINSFSSFFQNIQFDTAAALQSVDSYCEYLKNEYQSNVVFFENYAIIKYGSSSSGNSWKAHKQYQCAKEYADKMQAFYENLMQEQITEQEIMDGSISYSR